MRSPGLNRMGIFEMRIESWRVSTALALAFLTGCATPKLPHGNGSGLSHSTRSSIYARMELELPDSVLVKPHAPGADTNAFNLAPLFLRETPGKLFQALPIELIGATSASMPATNETVLCYTSTVQLSGRLHQQMTYEWFYPGSNQEAFGGISRQGIRMTLDSDGAPAIWEILEDPTGGDIIFVSDWVEASARRAHGTPLPDRRFSVERGLAQAPSTVVARVIDEGPLPMGPIVYLRADTQEIGTITCRCMPPQVAKVSGERDYTLYVAPDPATAAALVKWHQFEHSPKPAVQIEWPPGESLEQRLRLPADF